VTGPGWFYSEERRQWEHLDGRVIIDEMIAANPRCSPAYVDPSTAETMADVMGFAMDSEEARRQRLTPALYVEAYDAILRARR
jgi:hypothetical protein